MENINIDMVKENSIVKFINEDKTFLDGRVKTVHKNCLGIVINVNQSNYKEFSKNENIQLVFISGNQLIQCGATVIGLNIRENEQAIVVDMPKVIFKINRREYERIDIVMDVGYSLLPEGVEYEKLTMVESVHYRRYKKTYTMDISAGGINIVASINEKDSKFVLLTFSINDNNITTLCGMVRSMSMNDGKHKSVAYKFVDIQNHHRQLILDYVNIKLK